MKNKMLFLVMFLLLISPLMRSQTDIKVIKREFKNDKTGFREAWKHVKAGDNYYDGKGIWFGSAYDEYLKAVAYNGANRELNYKTGVSALFSDNKENAAGFFLKSIQEGSELTEDLLLLTGRALQYAGRYTEAIDKLNGYLNTSVKKPKENIISAKKYLEECGSALEVTKDTLRVGFRNMGSNINSNSDEYAELFSADRKTMFFASRRELSKSSTNYDDGKFDENIFFSSLNNGMWMFATTAGKKLITNLCEAPLYLSPTGEELYIYTGYENDGNIKVSNKKRGKWQAPESVPFKINSGKTESSLTFSPSGNEVWFVSGERKDGLGGKDIYMIKKLDERKWSKPVNAGPVINTPYDEESLRFSLRGDTLFFGSQGHNSIGGFDIFFSAKDSTGNWTKAMNIGYPVNTPWDEFFFNPAGDSDSIFYFASNRPGSMGGLDIFEGWKFAPEPVVIPVAVIVEPPKPDTVVVRDTVVVIKEIVQAPPPVVVPEPPEEKVLYLIGMIKDSETGDPVMAKVDIIDFATDLVVGTTASSDVDGSYRIKLPEKKSYMVDLRGTGFLSDMKRINIPANYAEDVYKLDVSLIKVKVGKKVVLNNILFETGKSILTTSSYAEIERLVAILEDTPQMRIEISGHTDNTGSLDLNNRLSQSRAQAVVEYLAQKGIDRSRLEFKGYGPTQPIAENTTAAGRTKNRRVEFKILEF
ncbi:MAG: OmpA family protein [Bacteroidales bacterium]|jgi:outer membrane protein OmpA-like peptidoglycan-associated protein|nr:OmpA family protein [Bacteroidales bacterium]